MAVFCKKALDLDELMTLLESRGLVFEDPAEVRKHLEDISYFRLSAYMHPYYVTDDKDQPFIAGTTFRQVLHLYIFDRELRLLLLDAIERLEVSLRAQLTKILSRHGPFGYLDACFFRDKYTKDQKLSNGTRLQAEHGKMKTYLAKRIGGDKPQCKEKFLKAYREKQGDSGKHPWPPVWMALELLSFGQISHMFAGLRNSDDKSPIGAHYGFKPPVLHSWFRSLSELRNYCAHHGRVWNREFGCGPMWPDKPQSQWVSVPEELPTSHMTVNPRRRLYYQLVIVATLLRVVSPDSSWAARLGNLLGRNPDIPLTHMGFPENWAEEPLWVKASVSRDRADFVWKAPVGQF